MQVVQGAGRCKLRGVSVPRERTQRDLRTVPRFQRQTASLRRQKGIYIHIIYVLQFLTIWFLPFKSLFFPPTQYFLTSTFLPSSFLVIPSYLTAHPWPLPLLSSLFLPLLPLTSSSFPFFFLPLPHSPSILLLLLSPSFLLLRLSFLLLPQFASFILLPSSLYIPPFYNSFFALRLTHSLLW